MRPVQSAKARQREESHREERKGKRRGEELTQGGGEKRNSTEDDEEETKVEMGTKDCYDDGKRNKMRKMVMQKRRKS